MSVLSGQQAYEDKLRHLAKRFSGGPGQEIHWAERALARKAKQARRDLLALCKAYNGHREYMVVVVLHMGTTFTNVQPTDDPERFTGLRYACKAEGNVPCGVTGTFNVKNVREFSLVGKSATITRR